MLAALLHDVNSQTISPGESLHAAMITFLEAFRLISQVQTRYFRLEEFLDA